MTFTLHPPKPMTAEQETRLEWALLELELAAPMPVDGQGMAPVELREEEKA